MKKQLLLLVLAIGFNSCSWADEFVDCTFLYIHLTNNSAQSCTLVNGNVISGELRTRVPERLTWGVMNHILMSESGNQGPKLHLEYDCGGKRIAFTSGQTVCKWTAPGKVSGQVTSADPGINASYTAADGSVFLVYAGMIDWTLATN